jgi:hypothetical protein
MRNPVSTLLCAGGFHHDDTDAFGGYDEHCSRCGRFVREGATPAFRGSWISVFGVAMIADALLFARSTGNEIFGLCAGGVLFVLGLGVIWFQKP